MTDVGDFLRKLVHNPNKISSRKNTKINSANKLSKKLQKIQKIGEIHVDGRKFAKGVIDIDREKDQGIKK